MFSFVNKPKILVDLNEELTHQLLQIKGEVPHWLSGTYCRNGPVNVAIDDLKNRHWFDGLAMLHAFKIDKGSIFYTNKFLRTQAYTEVFNNSSFNYLGFATPFTLNWYEKVKKWLNFPRQPILSNANQNILRINKRFVALGEKISQVMINIDTLNSLKAFDFPIKRDAECCWESTHPHDEVCAKRYINYFTEFAETNFYLVYSLQGDQEQFQQIAKIPVSNPSYMHSFAVTENFIILTEFPLILTNRLNTELPFIDQFKWIPQKGTNFLVIDRKNGQLVGNYKTMAFFAFHHVNAFENEGKIHLDLICYEDAQIISRLADHARPTTELENYSISRLVRFTLDFASAGITSNILFKKFNEFPCINPHYKQKNYQFVYLCDGRDTLLINEIRPLYKVNVQTKQYLEWSEEGCYPGEPFFIKSPYAQKEDEGVVLSIVIDAEKYQSFLLILDAMSFKEICRAQVPHVIPTGMHGQFFENER